MEKPKLKLVEPAPEREFQTPVVREIGRFAYLRSIQTLPDNVYLLPKTPPLDPEIA